MDVKNKKIKNQGKRPKTKIHSMFGGYLYYMKISGCKKNKKLKKLKYHIDIDKNINIYICVCVSACVYIHMYFSRVFDPMVRFSFFIATLLPIH